MTWLRLVAREIFYRKTNFGLGLVSIVIAVLCLGGAIASLRAFDAQTGQLVAEMEANTRADMAKLEDQIRRSMKGLGFNIYIFPEGQDMSDVYADGYASKTMPEAYATRLADSEIVTVNHLLPSLTRRIKWPERQRTVLLIGVRGELPLSHRKPKKPLIDPVERGTAVLGYELHRSLKLSPGSVISIMGQEFSVATCHDERGSVDDITIWLHLEEVQKLLGEEGRINTILALECNCATIDRLGEVRAEIAGILPGVQVIEKGSAALARAEARNTAAATARARIAEIQTKRAEMKRQRETFAAILVPAIMVFSMAWVALLTLMNVRDRTTEIGVLRSVGMRSYKLALTFLSRAGIMGLLGAAIGMAAGVALAAMVRDSHLHGIAVGDLVSRTEALLLLVATPVLACAAAWVPSLIAAQKDPATILHHD